MNRQDVAADRILAHTLKAGAYTAFALIATGLVLQVFRASAGKAVAVTGLAVLVATPGIRVIVAIVQFLRERDYRYVLVSLGVLAIVVLAYVLGIQ